MPTPKRKKAGGRPSPLTALYPDLVAFAYDHRLVTAEHVRYRFRLTKRTAARHLDQLTRQHGYLATVPIRHALSSFPRVYLATPAGLSFLQQAIRDRRGVAVNIERGEEPRPGRPRDITGVQHELDVTTFDLAADRTFGVLPRTVLAATVRRYHRQGLRYEGGSLIPDAGYHVLHDNEGLATLDLAFLELDRGTESLANIKAKLAAYDRWAESEYGQKYLQNIFHRYGDTLTDTPNFRLLIVAKARAGEGSDLDRLAAIAAEALACSPAMRRRTWLATYDNLVKAMAADAPLTENLFYRLRGDWIEAYRQATRRLQQAGIPDPDIAARQRAFLVRQLDRTTTLPLLAVKEAVI